MWCCKCNKDLVDCSCPDIDERLANLRSSPYCGIAIQQNIERRKEVKARRINKDKQNFDKRN
jgi:hypothetical protein